MLSEERNQLLCDVMPETPMGNLLRRYWYPIAGASELEERSTKAVRILGEDLVVFKDKSGAYGLIDRHCAHRRADLSYGFVEEHGLRCNYHGWLFDGTGSCLHQPFEATTHPEGDFRSKVKIKSYPVQEKAGLLWAYLGPGPAPELPDWATFHNRGWKQVVISEIPCNWLQCQENSIDPVHFEWLHLNWTSALRGEDEKAPTHTQLGFDKFDHGFVYRRVREDTTPEDDLWTVGRVCLWPNCLFTGSHFEWRVPIDNENTLSVVWFVHPLPGEEPYEQEQIPTWYSPIKDEDGRWISSHIINQDYIAWIGQGTIADRTKEHLGHSDRGVVALRRQLLKDVEAVAAGEDPMGVIRDPAVNDRIHLPTVGGLTRPSTSTPPEFPHLAGQPQEVRADFERAWASCEATSER